MAEVRAVYTGTGVTYLGPWVTYDWHDPVSYRDGVEASTAPIRHAIGALLGSLRYESRDESGSR
jgi:hypothetical protein